MLCEDTAQKERLFHDENRLRRIDASKAKPGPGGDLSDQEIRRIADEIERHYPHEAARRPRWQDSNLNHAIAGAGLRASAQGLGCYVAHGRSGDQLLAMSAGLPATDLFIDLEQRRSQLKSAGSAVFGALSATPLTLSPSINVSATSARFSSSLQHRRA